MDTTNLINEAKEKQNIFHPSLFETVNKDLPGDKRTLMNVTQERTQRLTSDRFEKLSAPGSYDLSTNDDSLSGSNTRYLFKNLYGETPLTFLFFSDKNVRNVQNLLRYHVHKKLNYVIDEQSTTELLIVMRGIFLEYSSHPPLLDEKMPKEEIDQLLNLYTKEVDRLNVLVINAILPKVVSQIQQYIQYLKDASQQPEQIERPINPSVKGQKEYRSVTEVLTGIM